MASRSDQTRDDPPPGHGGVPLPRRATRSLLAQQADVLARAASGSDLDELLADVCRMVEDPVRGVVCTILLVDGPSLRHGAAPGMPEAFTRAIDGERWGPDRGSCGTSVHTREPTLVEDVATDPRWEPWRELALGLGLRACWSVPVFGRDGEVLATFAAYARRPRLPSRDELELLDHASKLVAVLLEQHRDREELLDATDRLVELNRAIVAASRTKDDFLSMTSHELRTPLTPLLGVVETLQTHWPRFSDEERLSLLGVAARHGARLHELVDDLLTMSAANAGTLRTYPDVVDVRTMAELAVQAVLVDAAGVTIDVPHDVRVHADPRHVQQLLENYLSNAVKYAPEGPSRVSSHRDGDVVVVTVEDDGPGVPEELVPQLFELFTQGDSGDRRTTSGTGIGLAVVRALAAANHGEAWYEPAATGGARFAVSLPAAAPAPPSADPAVGQSGGSAS